MSNFSISKYVKSCTPRFPVWTPHFLIWTPHFGLTPSPRLNYTLYWSVLSEVFYWTGIFGNFFFGGGILRLRKGNSRWPCYSVWPTSLASRSKLPACLYSSSHWAVCRDEIADVKHQHEWFRRFLNELKLKWVRISYTNTGVNFADKRCFVLYIFARVRQRRVCVQHVSLITTEVAYRPTYA